MHKSLRTFTPWCWFSPLLPLLPLSRSPFLSLTAHSLNIHSLGPSLRIMARYWNTAVTTSSTWSGQSDGTYTTHAWIIPPFCSSDLSYSFNCAATSSPVPTSWKWLHNHSLVPRFLRLLTCWTTLTAFPGHHHKHSKCDGNQRLGMRLAPVTDLLPPLWGPWWH